MVQQKLKNLERFLQQTTNTAWGFTMNSSPYNPSPTPFGEHFKFLLQSRGSELSVLLDELAMAQIEEQNIKPEPPDFSQYIRYNSSYLNHKEVFVGNKWVLVPADACVDFYPTTIGSGANERVGFRVNITHDGNYANFSSTESLNEYQQNQNSLNGQQLVIEAKSSTNVSKQEFDWLRLAGQAYQYGERNTNALADAAEIYHHTPKEFKRTYAYKISKATKKLGKPAKAGKIFQGAKKLGKAGKKLGPIGNVLSAGTIGYELYTDTWDAHTVVDGALLVVGIAAATFGAPAVVVGIAVYGVLDYFFDISEGIDNTFGRDSGFWDSKPLRSFPRDTNPLFNEVKIDNTAVKKPLRIPPNFKD